MTVNLSNPLGAKLLWGLNPADSLNEQITGTVPSGTIGATATLTEGVAYIPAAASTNWATSGLTINPHDNDISLAWYGLIKVTGQPYFVRYVGGGYGWELKSEPWSGSQIQLKFIGYWSGAAATAIVNVTDNTVYHVGIRVNRVTNEIDVLLNGTVVAPGISWNTATDNPGSSAVLSMNNSGGGSNGCITLQCYGEALSDAEFASLAADPKQVFQAPPTVLTIPGATQANSVPSVGIQIPGFIYIDNLVQTNSISPAQVTRTQSLAAASVVQDNALPAVNFNPHSRMRAIVDSIPLHTWVAVNTTRYLDAQMPAGDRPYGAPNAYDHVKILIPWSSVAWDYDHARLYVWGGGHANYTGNQLYIWHGDTGEWELACLPSALDLTNSNWFIIDGKAPQSSHTYHNNIWLKYNNMFATFGGASLPSGGPPLEYNGGATRRVAPWLYDLTKIDSTKVGGSGGSGMNPARLGLNAWQHRRDKVPTGMAGTNAYPIDYQQHTSGTTVTIHKDGKDYAVMTMDNASGFPYWYRYEFGDVRAGENDTCTYLGPSGNTVLTEGWMVYDDKRDLVYRSANKNSPSYTQAELVVRNPWIPGAGLTPIRVVDSVTGEFFQMQTVPGSGDNPYGAAYDSREDCIWMWSGRLPDTGAVWRIDIPPYNPTTGWASTNWAITKINPAGTKPRGQPVQPVLGKVKYLPEVGGFVTLDSPSEDGSNDATVWIFKTSQLVTSPALSGASVAQSNAVSSGQVVQVEVGSALTPQQSIWLKNLALLHGLVHGSPLTVSSSARSSGDVVQAISEASGVVTVTTMSAPTGAPGPSKLSANEDAWLEGLARIYGLLEPLTVTPTARSAGTLTQAVSESVGVTTVTRI